MGKFGMPAAKETAESMATRMKITAKYLVDVRPPHFVYIPTSHITEKKHLQPWNGKIKDGKAVGYNPNGLYGLQGITPKDEQSKFEEDLKADELKKDAEKAKEVSTKKQEVKTEDIPEKVLEKDEHSEKVKKAKKKPSRKVNKRKSAEELKKELDESIG